jgi:hypothetical protein
MPIELSESLKNTCGVTFASRGMNGLFCSKFYTTLILTIMILILITVIYPCKKGTPFWIVGKLGFYIFAATLAILFLHDGVVYSSYKKEVAGGEGDEFVEALNGSDNVAFGGDNLPVNPKFGGDMMAGEGECCNGGAEGGNSEEIFAMFGV